MQVRVGRFALSVALIAAGGACRSQTLTYLTNYTKDNNIYTDLNEQFPHSGTGVPGSGVGTSNASFIFNPATYTSTNAVAGSNKTTNGVTFDITSNIGGQDFTQISSLAGSTLTIATSIANATSVSLLMNGYNNPQAEFTFTGTGGATESFNNIQLHDFNAQGAPNNYNGTYNGSLTPNFFDQTAFQVQDVGAGGSGNSTTGDFATYGIDEDSFMLSSAFAGQTLESITILAEGSNPLLLGATVVSTSVQPPANGTPEPGTVALLAAGLLSAGGVAIRRRRRLR